MAIENSGHDAPDHRVRRHSPTQRQRSSVTVRGLLRSVARNRTVLAALGVIGPINVVNSATAVALLPPTRDAWGQDDAGFGVATAWLGFGASEAPLLWWVRGSQERRRRWGPLVLGLATVWVGMAPMSVLALPVLALAGAVAVVVESSATQTIQVSMADEHRAGALGPGDSVMVLGALIGALLAPVLATAGGPRLTFSLCAVACLATAATAQWQSRSRAARPPLPSQRTQVSGRDRRASLSAGMAAHHDARLSMRLHRSLRRSTGPSPTG